MLNHIVLMGRMVRDPELRRTGSGVAVTSFTLAVDRDFSGKDGEKQTDFIDCVAWRGGAEFVSKYFSKGRMAVVSGSLHKRNWVDKNGANRETAEVLVDNIYFGDSKKESQNFGVIDNNDANPFEDNNDANPFEDNDDANPFEDDGKLPF
ncbi:MAG: single-stranded DNA-binding protein [Bacteroidaceae bacterium]|nr:single-stranded DNA-binding protein [Bacteroidaceae bacterium]